MHHQHRAKKFLMLVVKSCVANSWQMISAKSTQKFGRTHYLYIEPVLQRILPNKKHKKGESIS
jgi:hypothetical protein